ncbi:unnamed protein product [Amoebophrya sp. A25]|nr:unnamed protein product [Amoebophrya sp. A25]|eukprot:GSA25T00019938001.1
MSLIWKGVTDFRSLRVGKRRDCASDLCNALRQLSADINEEDREALVRLLTRQGEEKASATVKAGKKCYAEERHKLFGWRAIETKDMIKLITLAINKKDWTRGRVGRCITTDKKGQECAESIGINLSKLPPGENGSPDSVSMVQELQAFNAKSSGGLERKLEQMEQESDTSNTNLQKTKAEVDAEVIVLGKFYEPAPRALMNEVDVEYLAASSPVVEENKTTTRMKKNGKEPEISRSRTERRPKDKPLEPIVLGDAVKKLFKEDPPATGTKPAENKPAPKPQKVGLKPKKSPEEPAGKVIARAYVETETRDADGQPVQKLVTVFSDGSVEKKRLNAPEPKTNPAPAAKKAGPKKEAAVDVPTEATKVEETKEETVDGDVEMEQAEENEDASMLMDSAADEEQKEDEEAESKEEPADDDDDSAPEEPVTAAAPAAPKIAPAEDAKAADESDDDDDEMKALREQVEKANASQK